MSKMLKKGLPFVGVCSLVAVILGIGPVTANRIAYAVERGRAEASREELVELSRQDNLSTLFRRRQGGQTGRRRSPRDKVDGAAGSREIHAEVLQGGRTTVPVPLSFSFPSRASVRPSPEEAPTCRWFGQRRDRRCGERICRHQLSRGGQRRRS